MSSFQPLCPDRILSEAGTAVYGKTKLEYAEIMLSTNQRAKELCREGAPHGTLVLCEGQTAGRGRLRRSWETAPGEALAFSLLLRPCFPEEQMHFYTLAAALACSLAIEEVCPGFRCGIKWPNDLVIGGRKCVGILCEAVHAPDGSPFLVAGIGINVNQLSFPESISASAGSLLMERRRSDPSAATLDRTKLLCAVLRSLERVNAQMEANGFAGILPEYLARSVTVGQMVRVQSPSEEYRAEAIGVDEEGALLVIDETGTARRVLCGDVSVRGLMGYC